MEVTTSERYASGGDAPELPAQNLVKAFYAVRSIAWATTWRSATRRAIRSSTGTSFATRSTGSPAASRSSGVKKGDTVAIMLGNRWEFIPSRPGGRLPRRDSVLGLPDLRAGADPVPPLGRREQGRDHRAGVPRQRQRGAEGPPGARAPDRRRRRGRRPHPRRARWRWTREFDPAESVEQIGPDDLLTLIYTSGTTGPPKGVQLTHRNLLFAVATADEMIQLPERGGKVISWLPAAHVAERNAHYYLPVTQGLSVTVCADPRRIAEFLPKVRPTWFFAVPRIFEKLKAGLEAMLAGLPDEQRETAQKGLDASLAKVRAEQAGEEVPPEIAAGRRPGRRADVLRSCASSSGSTRRSPSTPAPRRRRSRCSSSSTRSASRSASSGACRRPADSAPSTRPTGSSSAPSVRRRPASRSGSTTTARSW